MRKIKDEIEELPIAQASEITGDIISHDEQPQQVVEQTVKRRGKHARDCTCEKCVSRKELKKLSEINLDLKQWLNTIFNEILGKGNPIWKMSDSEISLLALSTERFIDEKLPLLKKDNTTVVFIVTWSSIFLPRFLSANKPRFKSFWEKLKTKFNKNK